MANEDSIANHWGRGDVYARNIEERRTAPVKIPCRKPA